MRFLGLEGENTHYQNARVVVLPAPYEGTCSWGRGTFLGPAAILKASVAAEQYDESLDLDLEEAPIATLPPAPIEALEPEEMVEDLCRRAGDVFRDGKILAGLGGEHTVSLGFIKAALAVHPDLSVLQIDAHPDLREEYEGRRICHATVGRRILEHCPLVQAGLRAFSSSERRFLSAKPEGIHPFSAQFLHEHPEGIEKVVSALGKTVYLTLDVDALDPSILPHTGTPEPGGLMWNQVCNIIAAVAAHRKIVGFDVVELAPDASSRASDFTAARLCIRLISHCLSPGINPPGLPF